MLADVMRVTERVGVNAQPVVIGGKTFKRDDDRNVQKLKGQIAKSRQEAFAQRREQAIARSEQKQEKRYHFR